LFSHCEFVPSSRQQIDHLLIRGLIEFAVPHPDTVKRVGVRGANDLVYFGLKALSGIWRADGDRDDNSLGSLLAQELDRRTCRDACCKSVIYENSGPVLQIGHRPVAAVEAEPAVHLVGFSRNQRAQLRFCDAEPRRKLFVQYQYAAWCDRADSQLLSAWGADLARNGNVEWSMKLAGDFKGYDDPASRERQHDRAFIRESEQLSGEDPARFRPIFENQSSVRHLNSHESCLHGKPSTLVEPDACR